MVEVLPVAVVENRRLLCLILSDARHCPKPLRPFGRLELVVPQTIGGCAMVDDNAYRGSVRAPDFPDDPARWFNTDRPLHIQDLRGKIVILDFWTYC